MIRIRGADGNQRVFRQIKRIPESFAKGIRRANMIIGKTIQTEARRTINEDPKTGKLYIREDIWSGRMVMHRASAFGESPARFSGSLAASIGYSPSTGRLIVGAGTTGRDVQAFGAAAGQIGFGQIVDYASKLELRMNRPYLKPSIAKKQKDTENYYLREIGRELSKL